MTNPTNHENYILTDEWVRENARMFDLISADFVLEHLDDKKKFYSNINTLLKDDGVFCARTPHKYSYVALIEHVDTLIISSSYIKKAQPKRESIDVFKAYYRLNIPYRMLMKFLIAILMRAIYLFLSQHIFTLINSTEKY